MQIPHSINNNTFKAYQASPETLKLLGERDRQIQSEDFDWNKFHLPKLVDLCVQCISRNFANKPILNELPCPDRNYLLEILDTNLDLQLVVPLIDDEIYWQRRYNAKFDRIKSRPQSWKQAYIEREVRKWVEEAEPQYNDEEQMTDQLHLATPFVRTLLVSQLMAWKPPRTWSEEDIPENYPVDHITFAPIFSKLTNIETLDVTFGMNNVGEEFEERMFQLSVADCQRLGAALEFLPCLKIFRLHRSRLENDHIRALTHGLINNHTLIELDLSHCNFGDVGALCIAKVLIMHSTLKQLIIADNLIGQSGGESIGYALINPGSCSLEQLDMRLNPLRYDGTMGILRALVRIQKPQILSLAGCKFDGETPLRIGQMLQLNQSLTRLDISNNWLDIEGGEAIVAGMQINLTLEWLNVHETDITIDQYNQIQKYLKRNRGEVEEVSVNENIELFVNEDEDEMNETEHNDSSEKEEKDDNN